MTECITNCHPHNARCRYTTGFYCEDCGVFFPKDSPEYIRYALPADLSRVVRNIGVEYTRLGEQKPDVVDTLLADLNGLWKVDDADRRQYVLNYALRFIASHRKNENSATLPLRC